MPKYSPALKLLLDPAVTKLDLSSRINTLLTSTRRVRCFRDANAAASNPAATGVEFFNIGSTGILPTAAGNLTGFGRITGTTKKLAADLSSGSAVVVIEGNGHSITYTLGLPGSGAEFILPASPTGAANETLAFTPGSGMKAPIMMDSGTGPLSPPAPVWTVDVMDCTNDPTTGMLAGTINLSVRMINQVFDDQEMATSMGDVRVHRCPQSVVLGEVEFGALLWSKNASLNAEAGAPVDEIMVLQKPVDASWDNYPVYSGYKPGISNTFAPPYKLVFKKDGVVKHIEQMRDGLPMNHPSLNQGDRSHGVEIAPIRPFMNTGHVTLFRNYRHKMHTYAQKYFPGFQPDILRPTTTRQRVSTNPTIPQYYYDQLTGISHWHWMPKWAVAANSGAYAADVCNDPYLMNPNADQIGYGPMQNGGSRMVGWGYEPGAIGGMDMLSGPGGARNDRASIPASIAVYMTDPAYVRPRNNDPIQEMVDAWNQNYCNIPWHLVTDVTTGDTIPLDEVFAGMWSQGSSTYYGAVDTFVPGGRDKSVPFFNNIHALGGGQADGSKPFWGATVDKNGRMPFNGAVTDYHHCYKSAFWYCVLFNSPAAAYLTKHAIINNIICNLDATEPGARIHDWFMTRRMAWRFKSLVDGWKISSDHPLGIPRKLVVDRAVKELEAVYALYEQIILNNAQDPYSKGIRNLGVPLMHDPGYWAMASQSLMFYMAGELQKAKSTGFWDFIRAYSVKCKVALDFIVQCLDKYSVDWMLDTNGTYDWYDDRVFMNSDRGTDATVVIASNWAQVNTLPSPAGDLDWITDANGTFRTYEHDGSQHLRYQYVCMRRDWITEADVPVARGTGSLQAAIAQYKGFYDTVANNVAAKIAANAPKDQCRNADWTYRQMGYGVYKPPVSI